MRNTPRRKVAIPIPRNGSEFAALTKYVFGKPLSLSRLNVYSSSGSYEVREAFDSYNKNARELGKYLFAWGSRDIGNFDYDANSWFMDICFGPLYCGGIANSAYGQFNIIGHRQLNRLNNWVQQRNGRGFSDPRPSFARLASHRRGWREQKDASYVCTDHAAEVDGEQAVSLAKEQN